MGITFKAGKYWIGDPCYAVKDENWVSLLKRTNYLDDGEFEYNNQRCFASGTSYGDGEYQDNLGNSYGVDAGLIGIMPLEACDGDYLDGGNIIDFNEDFEIDYDNGIFEFGNIIINTKDDNEEDEDY